MTKATLSGFAFLLVFACSAPRDNNSARYTFPPEWHAHSAIWLDWTDLGAFDTKIEIIKALHADVPVNVLTHSDSLASLLREMMTQAGIDTSRITVYQHAVPSYFLRDSGPKYLTNGTDLVIADFDWNCYGFADYGPDCYERRKTVSDLAALSGIKTVPSDIVTEGGALEVNESTIIAFRSMATSRNPGKPLREIEAEFLKMYGKQKLIWIDETPIIDIPGHKAANYFGMGANGHIDEYMRFVNDSTILVGVIDSVEADANPINKTEFALLRRNLAQISAERNANGRPFRIIPIPMPDFMQYARKEILSERTKRMYPEWYKDFHAGDSVIQIPIMSYLNFFITNNTVLVSGYWTEGISLREKQKDQLVFDTLSKLFPDRKIIQINPIGLNWWGGGIHCSTQQVPAL